MSLKLNAPGGGSVTLQEPTTASNRTLNLPDADGTALLQGTTLTRATAVTASGTSVDFTGIPSWVKRITVMFNGVSTNGTSSLLVQIGAGSFTTSGYSQRSVRIGITSVDQQDMSTAGFSITASQASNSLFVPVILTLVTGNIWLSNHFGYSAGNANLISGGGGITLSGTLDRVRITTVNGTDTFDAGTINIMWEG